MAIQTDPDGVQTSRDRRTGVPKRRMRAKAPKVRTGCLTCKIRRVKCDEAKPKCDRCVRFGMVCDGYLPTSQKDLDRKAAKKRNHTEILPLYMPPPANRFKDDGEYYYFSRFCCERAAPLESCHQSPIWSRIVLQASENDPSIRHGVIALGALDFKDWANRESMDSRRREFAYREYHLALLALKRGIAEKRIDLRTRILLCIVFICFESYHGNNPGAVSQIVAGIEVVGQYMRERAIAQLSNEGHLYPALDEGILMMFAILEVQAGSFIARRSPTYHLGRMQMARAALEKMPPEFKTLQDAQRSLALLVLATMHWWLGNSASPVNYFSTLVGFQLTNSEETSTISQIGRYLTEYEQWNEAYKPLLRRARSLQGRANFKMVALTKLYYLSTYLWIATAAPNAQMSRRFTRELVETVQLARELIELPDNSVVGESFSLDTRLVLPLIVCGYKYRHRAARREVIEIFTKVLKSRREGLWDTVLAGKLMKWVASLEEVGLTDEEYVPEDAVLAITSMETDVAKRSTLVRGIQRVRGLKGITVLRDITLSW